MRDIILAAQDYNFLWGEICREFRAALANDRDDFVARFFRYAAWTLSPGPQTRTMPQVSQSAAEIFYEFADELHRWIDRHDFMMIQKGLRYYLGEDRYGEFEHRFLARTRKYVSKRTSETELMCLI